MPDLAGRVSLIVWHDPKTDPPEMNSGYVLAVLVGAKHSYPTTGEQVATHAKAYALWAELPTPSEATWHDLKHTVDIAEEAWGGTDPEVTRVVALIADGEGDP